MKREKACHMATSFKNRPKKRTQWRELRKIPNSFALKDAKCLIVSTFRINDHLLSSMQ